MSDENYTPLLLLSIIVILVIVGTISGNSSLKYDKSETKESFSPLGFASNCPEFKLPKTDLKVDGCGPGCWMLKDKKEGFQSGKSKSKKRSCTTDRIPKIPEELPIGHLSTMGSPLLGQAMCTSNINGVQKMMNKNPFGSLTVDNQFQQSYASCGFGSNNIFDKNQLNF